MEPVKLVTSKEFSRDELIAFLLQIGVKRDETPNRLWDYVLRMGEAIVWIDPDDQEHYPNPEVDALIESKLGNPPRTYIVLHMSRNLGSEQLALELAIQFAKRWPCVLDNLSSLARRIFTLEELQALYDSGQGLRDDEKEVSLPQEWYTADEEYLAPWQQEKHEKQNPEFLEQALMLMVGREFFLKEADSKIVTEEDYVQSVLAEMEPVLREVLLLSAARHSLAEITRLLGCKESTVTAYLAKARKQFRQLYRVIGNTDGGSDKEKNSAEAHKAS